MKKVIIALVIVAVVYFLFFRKSSSAATTNTGQNPDNTAAPQQATQATLGATVSHSNLNLSI